MILPHQSIVNTSNSISDDESQTLRLSPYDALKSLDNALWKKREIKSLTLRRIGNADVYEFVLTGGKKYLVNAYSGLLFEVTSEVAKNIASIARNSLGKEASILSVELLDRHSYFYSYGDLPVYKVELGDDLHTKIYVSSKSGKIVNEFIVYWV